MQRFKSVFFVFISILMMMKLIACKHHSKDTYFDEKSGKYLIKLNYSSGEKYNYASFVKQELSIKNQIPIHQEVTTHLVYEFLTREEKLKLYKITCNQVLFKMNGSFGELSFDSNNDEQNAVLKDLGKLAGTSLTFYLDDKGGIKKTTYSSHSTSTASTFPLQSQDSTFQVLMQNAFELYPGKEVRIGDHWKKKSQIDLAGFLFNVENEYTLKSVSKGVAKITLSSKMNTPDYIENYSEFNMKLDIKGVQKGQFLVDLRNGNIIEAESIQRLEGFIHTENQKTPVKIKSTSTIKSEK